MNISSVVITLKDEKLQDEFIKEIKEFKECEVSVVEKTKVVLLLETREFDDQIKIFKAIERLKEVESLAMAYSYTLLGEVSEDLDIASILNEEKDAKDISYSGEVVVML